MVVAGGLFAAAASLFFLLVEQPSTPRAGARGPGLVETIKGIPALYRSDRVFLRYGASRVVVMWGMSAFAFFTVFAVRDLGASDADAVRLTAVLVASQLIGSLGFGALGDRVSARWLPLYGSVIAVIGLLIALPRRQPGRDIHRNLRRRADDIHVHDLRSVGDPPSVAFSQAANLLRHPQPHLGTVYRCGANSRGRSCQRCRLHRDVRRGRGREFGRRPVDSRIRPRLRPPQPAAASHIEQGWRGTHQIKHVRQRPVLVERRLSNPSSAPSIVAGYTESRCMQSELQTEVGIRSRPIGSNWLQAVSR